MEDALDQISECDSTKIEVRAEDPTCRSPWFTEANVRALNRQLTKSYACTKAGTQILHQDIVTMEILRYNYGHNVIYTQTATEVQRYICKIRDGDGSRVLAFLHVNQFAHPARVAKLYDKLTHEVSILYPTRDEIIWEQGKIYDLQLLDEIASNAGAWRPKTCYRTGDICKLADKNHTVFKRSHSCGGGHVKFVDRTKQKDSPCRDLAGVMDATMITKTNTVDLDETYGIDYARWIHQEYLPSLIDCEIRVFIATRLKENNKKEENLREPYVVLMVNSCFVYPEEHSEGKRVKKTNTREPQADLTRTNKREFISKRRSRSAKTNAAKSIQRQLQSDELEGEEDDDEEEEDEELMAFEAVIVTEDFRWNQHPHLRRHHVEVYALSMYYALLESNSKGFDSLKVGVRLDIGVAPNGEDLFVNEITRWYQADHFSSIVGTGDRVARAWAGSFAEVYPAAENAVRIQELGQNAERKSISNIAGATAFQRPERTSSTSTNEDEPPQRYKVLGRNKYIRSTKRKAEALPDINEQHISNVVPKKPRAEVKASRVCNRERREMIEVDNVAYRKTVDVVPKKKQTVKPDGSIASRSTRTEKVVNREGELIQKSSFRSDTARAMNTVLPTFGNNSRGNFCETTIRRSDRNMAQKRKKWGELVLDDF
jgi:hypothetical protein